jgi:hypothetical protein
VSSLKAELSSLSSDPRLASSPPLPQASHGVADGLLKKVEELRGSAKGKDEGASTSTASTDPQANVSHFHPTSSHRTFDLRKLLMNMHMLVLTTSAVDLSSSRPCSYPPHFDTSIQAHSCFCCLQVVYELYYDPSRSQGRARSLQSLDARLSSLERLLTSGQGEEGVEGLRANAPASLVLSSKHQTLTDAIAKVHL